MYLFTKCKKNKKKIEFLTEQKLKYISALVQTFKTHKTSCLRTTKFFEFNIERRFKKLLKTYTKIFIS